MILIPFLSSASPLAQEQLGECAGKRLCYSDDWTLVSGKGVRKDGCLYPSDQQNRWSREERWSVADGAR